MPKNFYAAPVALLLFVALGATASAQFGFGGGVATSGEDLRAATGNFASLVTADSITYSDISGGTGFFVSGRLKWSLAGPLRIAGDVAYLFFPARNITVTSLETNGQEVSGTFDVGATMLPLSLGLDLAIPIPVLRPYVSAQAVYTFVSRTSAFVSGASELNTADVTNNWGDEGEFGAAFGAGVELVLGAVTIDLGARYNLADLFTSGSDEPSVKFLQVGATLYFGSTLSSGDDDSDHDD